MKDNAGKHFAAQFFGHSQKHLRKCHGILKVIKGKLRKRFMHWTETNIYWTSMKNKQHLNLLVRLSFSIALNLKVVSIDRAWHINLVGHFFSDHNLLNLKQEQQESFVSSVVTAQICSG